MTHSYFLITHSNLTHEIYIAWNEYNHLFGLQSSFLFTFSLTFSFVIILSFGALLVPVVKYTIKHDAKMAFPRGSLLECES